MTNVIDEIAAERQRQISVEGWTAEHDDGHTGRELVRAAAAYALDNPYFWPFDEPPNFKAPRRNLIRAAALIVAEIERLDRRTEPE